MDGRALIRLRIAFLLLGAALLLPLALLLRSVDMRLEAQRRLRHELVAERIFDEMEGELSALLAREDARPSDAYAGTSTRVENWAPFVVGYFTRDRRGVQIVAKPQLAPERLHRLEALLRVTAGQSEEARPAPRDASAAPAAPSAVKVGAYPREDKTAKTSAGGHYGAGPGKGPSVNTLAAEGAQTAAQEVQPLPEAILKQLNRAADVREREQARPAAKRKALSRDENDPLSGLE